MQALLASPPALAMMALMPMPPLSSRLGDVVDPGDVVLVENPSFLAALQSFGFAGAGLEPVPCDGGMFVWARPPEGWDPEALLHRALQHDVAFVPGHPFFAREPDPRTLGLSFTTHVPHEIAEGLSRLRRSWTDWTDRTDRTDRTDAA